MSDDANKQADRVLAMMKKSTETLIEHCDSVIIIATIREDGKTLALDANLGNAFATDGALVYTVNKRKTLDKAYWWEQKDGQDE